MDLVLPALFPFNFSLKENRVQGEETILQQELNGMTWRAQWDDWNNTHLLRGTCRIL